MPLIINSPSNNFYMHLVNCSSLRLRPGAGPEKLPHTRGQGRWPRGAAPPPRSGCEGREELVHVQGREGRR